MLSAAASPADVDRAVTSDSQQPAPDFRKARHSRLEMELNLYTKPPTPAVDRAPPATHSLHYLCRCAASYHSSAKTKPLSKFQASTRLVSHPRKDLDDQVWRGNVQCELLMSDVYRTLESFEYCRYMRHSPRRNNALRLRRYSNCTRIRNTRPLTTADGKSCDTKVQAIIVP